MRVIAIKNVLFQIRYTMNQSIAGGVLLFRNLAGQQLDS